MRWLDWYGDGSVWVVDLALACCALEVEAATLQRPTAPQLSVAQQLPLVGQPRGSLQHPPTERLLASAGAARTATGPPAMMDGAQVVAVVSGTVTDQLVPVVMGLLDGIERLAGRTPAVVSFGACASSGGPYWDSYAVTKGVDQVVAVDAYVPGCPPPPEALAEVVDRLTRVTAR